VTNKVLIEDGDGGGHSAGVTGDHEIKVIVSPYPPIERQKAIPFRQYLTDDGTAAGNNDMGVDGSVTNIDYYIEADKSDDIYITSLNFIVGYGTTGQPNEWADGTALTNGCHLFYETIAGGSDIHDGIKTNQDFFRLMFSPVQANWEVRHVNASNDYGYFISMDLARMGLPYGIKLDRASRQRLVLCIKDNVGAAADSFNCIAYGFKRFE